MEEGFCLHTGHSRHALLALYVAREHVAMKCGVVESILYKVHPILIRFIIISSHLLIITYVCLCPWKQKHTTGEADIYTYIETRMCDKNESNEMG